MVVEAVSCRKRTSPSHLADQSFTEKNSTAQLVCVEGDGSHSVRAQRSQATIIARFGC